MKKLSITTITNTGTPETIGGITFETDVQTVVYNNKNLFSDDEALMNMVNLVSENVFLCFDFDGNSLSQDEALKDMNYTKNKYTIVQSEPSYLDSRNWQKAACEDLLDGLLNQMDEFDWLGADVKQTRVEFMIDGESVFNALSIGYLVDAYNALTEMKAGDPDDFLNDYRLAQFQALFYSALQ